MRSRFPLTPLSWVILFFLTTSGSAQDIFVTPIAGVPFTGIIQVQRLFVQPNGSTVIFKTVREIARDSRGRIHNETRALVPSSATQTPEVVRTLLYDPETRISTMIFARERTFSIQTLDRPPATIPTRLFDASPTADNVPASQFTKKEDLGVQDIEELPAHGVRQTQTIPADTTTAGRETSVIDEYWYSNDLRINLMIRHSDPRTGAVIMTVTQINRAEPNAVFFQIPKGYKRAGQVAASTR